MPRAQPSSSPPLIRWLSRARTESTPPIYVHFGDLTKFPGLNATTFFDTFGSAYGLDSDNQMQAVAVKEDDYGHKHYSFQQYQYGRRIVGGEYTLHEVVGQTKPFPTTPVLRSGGGRIAPKLKPAFAAAPQLTYGQALAACLEGLLLQPGDLEVVLMRELAISAVGYNIADAKDYHLVYIFDIEASNVGGPYSLRAEIDANDGTLVNIRSNLQSADVTVQGDTRFDGRQNIVVDNAGAQRLREVARNIHVRDAQNGGQPSGAPPPSVEIAGPYINSPAVAVIDGVSVKWGLERAYDYFDTKHGRPGWNGVGQLSPAYVRFAAANAFYNLVHQYMGFNVAFTTLDIVAHEYTHGVIAAEGALLDGQESRGLNESFADIFATMTEFHANSLGFPNVNPDWLIGGEKEPGGFRNMKNPKAKGDPDTYQGDNWSIPFVPCGSCPEPPIPDIAGTIHSLAGPHNRHFYLLAQGGSGTNDFGWAYNVTGIGRDNAAKVVYHNLRFKAQRCSRYPDLFLSAVDSAEEVGLGSSAINSTIDAWFAIGLDADLQILTVPTAPEDLEATLNGAGFIDLTWTDTSDNEDEFRMQRRINGGNWHDFRIFDANETSYTDTNLTPDTQYKYRILASNAKGESAWNTSNAVSTAPVAPPIPVPTNLQITVNSCAPDLSCRVVVEWDDSGTGGHTFQVLRAEESGPFVVVEDCNFGTSYCDVNVTSGVTYQYKVKKWNYPDLSDPSAPVSVTVAPPLPAGLNAPSDLAGQTWCNIIAPGVTTCYVDLQWTDNSDNETSFEIWRAVGFGSQDFTLYSEVAATTSVGRFEDHNIDEDQNETYRYKVRAANLTSVSDFTSVVDFTIP